MIAERAEGRGWQLAEDDRLRGAPDAARARWSAGSRAAASDAEVTCFINNIGLGYQFAAAGSVVYRKAKEARPRPRAADRLVHRGRASLMPWLSRSR